MFRGSPRFRDRSGGADFPVGFVCWCFRGVVFGVLCFSPLSRGVSRALKLASIPIARNLLLGGGNVGGNGGGNTRSRRSAGARTNKPNPVRPAGGSVRIETHTSFANQLPILHNTTPKIRLRRNEELVHSRPRSVPVPHNRGHWRRLRLRGHRGWHMAPREGRTPVPQGGEAVRRARQLRREGSGHGGAIRRLGRSVRLLRLQSQRHQAEGVCVCGRVCV